jgi:hypothetical protein
MAPPRQEAVDRAIARSVEEMGQSQSSFRHALVGTIGDRLSGNPATICEAVMPAVVAILQNRRPLQTT